MDRDNVELLVTNENKSSQLTSFTLNNIKKAVEKILKVYQALPDDKEDGENTDEIKIGTLCVHVSAKEKYATRTGSCAQHKYVVE